VKAKEPKLEWIAAPSCGAGTSDKKGSRKRRTALKPRTDLPGARAARQETFENQRGYPHCPVLTPEHVRRPLRLSCLAATIFFFSRIVFCGARRLVSLFHCSCSFFRTWSPHQIEIGHAVIRKLAHVNAYFILAILCYGTLKWQKRDVLDAKIWTGVLVAADRASERVPPEPDLDTRSSIAMWDTIVWGALGLWLISIYESRRTSHSICEQRCYYCHTLPCLPSKHMESMSPLIRESGFSQLKEQPETDILWRRHAVHY